MYWASAESVADPLEWTEVGHCLSPQWDPPQAWPSLPSFGSNTWVLSGYLETECADLLSQALQVL